MGGGGDLGPFFREDDGTVGLELKSAKCTVLKGPEARHPKTVGGQNPSMILADTPDGGTVLEGGLDTPEWETGGQGQRVRRECK